ncbi:B-type flagellin [Novipirellula galeiformis]|uniref:Flagellin n=1 Tax=Novipirellula galeiformis TaxID=2528004 RepID=A0A5C6C361_9BACT|nr:flagellin [Novipirellula galeiformis]TWU17704.1 B-type flagellin [Novipirellula galeiformis]
MTRINTNVSSLVAQNRLQASNTDLQTALTRLSTGLRINSGADDPAGLIASEALRSEISSLNKAISNTRRASQIISTADSALGEVSNLLNDIRGLVVEAANSGALSDEEIAANQLQIDSSLEAINRIAQTTTFQGRKLLDGSLDFVSSANSVPSIVDVNIDQANLGATGQIDVDVKISAAATQAKIDVDPAAFAEAKSSVEIGTAANSVTLTADANGSEFNDYTVVFDDQATGAAATAALDTDTNIITVTYDSTSGTSTHNDYDAIKTALSTITGFTATNTGTAPDGTAAFTPPAGTLVTAGGATADVLADKLVFQLNGTDGAETFNFGAGTSGDQIAAAINLVKDSTGVEATYTSLTGLSFQSTAYGENSLVNLEVINEGTLGKFAANMSAARDTGTDIKATINGVEANGKANQFSINTSTLDISLSVSEGSSTAFNFSITDGGALFQLGPDVTTNQQARMGIGSVSTGQLGGSSGRLYELGSGQSKSLTNGINEAAEVIDEVIAKVTGLRGRLGAFQATTLASNLVSLGETSSNLQEAESSIRDADFAQESANLTRAQILVQSGTNVLSLANQNPQNVLSLLR